MYPYDFQSPQMGQNPYPQQPMGQNPYGMESMGQNSYSGQQAGHAPYSYPMNNPQAIMPQPTGATSYGSPFYSGQQSGMQNNMQQARYAHGGSARPRNMHSLADALRSKGQGGDSVLAHISPEEAHMLGQQEGYDINPHTGLPQYGFLKKAFKGLRKNKLIRNLLPIVGGIVGNMIAPGIGGAIGGGLAGAAGNKNPLKGGLMGGVMGYGAGKLANNIGAGGFGNAFGGAGNAAKGITAADKLAMSKAGFGHMDLAGMAKGAGKGGGGGILDSILGGGGGGGGFLGNLLGGGNGLANNILPLVMAGGIAGRKRQQVKEPPIRDINEQLHQAGIGGKDVRPLPPVKPYNLKLKPGMPELDPEKNAFEGEYYPYEEPDINQYRFAHGGHLDGDTDGQADKIDAKLSDGEFVIRADVVSDLGDGNNKSGAKKLYDFMHNISKHKRSKKTGLPPKAKSIEQYMRAKGGKRHAV